MKKYLLIVLLVAACTKEAAVKPPAPVPTTFSFTSPGGIQVSGALNPGAKTTVHQRQARAEMAAKLLEK